MFPPPIKAMSTVPGLFPPPSRTTAAACTCGVRDTSQLPHTFDSCGCGWSRSATLRPQASLVLCCRQTDKERLCESTEGDGPLCWLSRGSPARLPDSTAPRRSCVPRTAAGRHAAAVRPAMPNTSGKTAIRLQLNCLRANVAPRGIPAGSPTPAEKRRAPSDGRYICREPRATSLSVEVAWSPAEESPLMSGCTTPTFPPIPVFPLRHHPRFDLRHGDVTKVPVGPGALTRPWGDPQRHLCNAD